MREKKNEIVEKQLFSVLSFFCLSAFFKIFFSSFHMFFFVLFWLIAPRTVPNGEQQTNKQKNPIISASIAQSQRGFGDGMESYRPNSWMNTEGG